MNKLRVAMLGLLLLGCPARTSFCAQPLPNTVQPSATADQGTQRADFDDMFDEYDAAQAAAGQAASTPTDPIDQKMAIESTKTPPLMGADAQALEQLKRAVTFLADQDIQEAALFRTILIRLQEEPPASYLLAPSSNGSATLVLYPELPVQQPVAYQLSPDQAGALEMLLTDPSVLEKVRSEAIKPGESIEGQAEEPEEKSSSKSVDEKPAPDLSSPHSQPERKRRGGGGSRNSGQSTEPSNFATPHQPESFPEAPVFQQPTAASAPQQPRPHNPMMGQPAPVGGVIQPAQPRTVTPAKDATIEEVAAIRRPSASRSALLQTRVPDPEPTRRYYANATPPLLDHVRKTQRTSSLTKTCFEDEPEDDETEELEIIQEEGGVSGVARTSSLSQGVAKTEKEGFFKRMNSAVSNFFTDMWHTIKTFFFGTTQECS